MPVWMLSGELVQLTPVFISIFWKKAKLIIRPRKKISVVQVTRPTLNFYSLP